jgi:hypothetical protein
MTEGIMRAVSEKKGASQQTAGSNRSTTLRRIYQKETKSQDHRKIDELQF